MSVYYKSGDVEIYQTVHVCRLILAGKWFIMSNHDSLDPLEYKKWGQFISQSKTIWYIQELNQKLNFEE